MAAADYRLCDVCSGKCFYDSNLNYETPDNWNVHRTPYRTLGEPQYSTQELVDKHGYILDYLGDWAVICSECAKTHKCIVVPTTPPDGAKGEW
jgi:hypothetical protein